jgi:hypothetical protein
MTKDKNSMADSDYKVFRAVSVLIVEIQSATKFTVLPITSDDGTIDLSAKRFEVDLMKTPSRGPWKAVAFDDRGVNAANQILPPQSDASMVPLGITNIGATSDADDLLRAAFIGAVYVERTLFERLALGTKTYPWPPAEYALYQLTSIAYRANTKDARAGKRYHGFRGTVIETQGSLIRVTFPQPVGASLGPWWFNTSDVDDVDGKPPVEAVGRLAKGQKGESGEKVLGANSKIGDTGPLFLALPGATIKKMFGPKIPVGESE